MPLEVGFCGRVRYGETDQMGVAYYANYLTWFEVGRTEFCRELGRPYSFWEKEGIFLPVVEAHCRYKRPAMYDDEILIRTGITSLKKYSLQFQCHIAKKNDGKVIAEGWTRHGIVDREGKLIKGANLFMDWVRSVIENDNGGGVTVE